MLLILALLTGPLIQPGTPAPDCSVGTDNPGGTLETVPGDGESFGGSEIHTFRIEIESGLALDEACVATTVEGVLGDPRSWIHEDNLGWRQADSDPDLRIIFASPDTTDDLCEPLNTAGIFSCRNGNRVVINVWRWRTGTPDYVSNLDEYRRYVINHEVGHYLGHGHTSCPSTGSLAPVMMQQTKSLDGCAMNGWPYPNAEVIPTDWNGTFWDDDSSIFEGDIEWAHATGITVGCNPPEATMFCPQETVTRAQMAAFLVRARDLPPADVDAFNDDDGSIFEDVINRLAATGITRGCAENLFCPDRAVTRGEMAAFLHRAYPTLAPGQPIMFTDTSDSLFASDIEWLSATGITSGCDTNHFCPNEHVTRGQMAAFLHRAEAAP